MIYFFYGNNREETYGKLKKVLAVFRKKRPEATVFTLTADNWNDALFEESLSGQGLFDRKTIIFLDSIFARSDAKETVLANLISVQESENAFLFIEGKTDSSLISCFEKVGATIEHVVSGKEKNNSGSVFSLTDAWARGDKRKAWLMYQSLSKTMSPEEIHGALFWQVKTILLSELLPSVGRSGLKPFVFKRAAVFSKKRPKEKIKKTISTLLEIYHNAHNGKGELSLAVEKFILEG